MNFDQFMNVIWSFKAIPTDLFSNIIEYNINCEPPGVTLELFFAKEPADKSYKSSAEYISLNSDFESIYITNDMEESMNKCIATSNAFDEIQIKYFCYVISENKNTHGFSETIKKTSFDVIDDWFRKNSNNVGQVLLLNHLTINNVLRPIFEDAKNSAAELANKICDDVFINGFMIESQTAGSYLPGKVLLLVLKSLDRAGTNFQKNHHQMEQTS